MSSPVTRSPGKGRSETCSKRDETASQACLARHSTLVATQQSTWSGLAAESDGFLSPASYIVQLDDKDIQEITHDALPRFKSLNLDGDQVNPHNFALPSVKSKLERAAIEVHQGSGLAIVRGLQPSQHSVEDNLVVFLALSSYVGDVRGVQNRKGDIINAKQWNAPYAMRHGIHTNKDLPFHNDMGTDILALHVRQCATEGGHTYVASAGKIYCELAARRPDVLETLTRADWPIQVSASPLRYINVPLLQLHHGRVMINLDPGRLGLSPEATRIPHGSSLTPGQHEALAVLSSIATTHRLRLDTQPGDLVFINNWALLHARDSYKDGASSSRHLVRLWLRNSKLGWAVPAPMRTPWEAAFGPDGMGDATDENTWRKSEYRGSGLFSRNYPVLPPLEYKVPKYTSGSAAFLMEDDHEGHD